MSAHGTQLDHSAVVEPETIAIVRDLLEELGNPHAIEALDKRGPAAHLERDLGLGSLERVELLLRIDKAFSLRLPDQIFAEADTLENLISAIAVARRSGQHAFITPGIKPASEFPPQAGKPSFYDPSAAESITELLLRRGRSEPDRPHIHLYGEDEQTHTISFGELLTRATSVAAELQRKGLEPGSTVAIMLPTSAEFFSTFAGILLAGAIPVPMYPPFRTDRIEEYAARQAGILRNAEARFLVTFREVHAVARLIQLRVPSLREILSAAKLAGTSGPQSVPVTELRPAETIANHAKATDIAFLQYTSGSTGDPKGVVLTHANLLANIRSIISGLGIEDCDVAVSWLPLYHDMGLIGAWFVPLYTGIPLVLMSPLAFLSRPERWLWALHRHRGTLSPAPNFAFELCVRRIADEDIQGLDLSSVRAMLNGAEPVQPETLEKFAARFGRYGLRKEALLPVYGLAEASLGVAASPIGKGYKVDRIDRAEFEETGQAIPLVRSGQGAQGVKDGTAVLEFVSAGKPMPGTDIRIVDADEKELPERREGRLWFRSGSTTSGYYRNPEATKQIVRPNGFVNSGDLAYIADGEVYITGRAKDLIIKGGRNIYPQDVEVAAGRVAGVRTGCVVAFGVPEPRSGTEKLVIAAEVRNGSNLDGVRAEVTREVSELIGMPPDAIELLPPHSIPKTSSGKLRRSETRRLYLSGALGKRPAALWIQASRLMMRGAWPQALALLRRAGDRAGEVAYGVYSLAVVGLVFAAVWAAVLPVRDQKRAARITRFFARWMLRLALVRIETECELPESSLEAGMAASGPWVFTPNHASYLDVIVLVAAMPPGVRIVAKGDVLKIPVIGMLLRRCGHFAFERADAQARIVQAKELEQALLRGESILLFPEGTFTDVNGIRPFQLGAFKAAVNGGRPVCPIAIRGTRKILRDNTYLPRFGRVSMRYGPLLFPNVILPSGNGSTPRVEGADWHEMVRLRDATREIISQKTGEPLL